MNKNTLYLLSILEAIEKIAIYKNDFQDALTFFEANNQKEFNATLNLLIAIGEESKNLDDSLKSNIEIDWKAIIGLRNVLSHNYRGVDSIIIWDIINNYLDPLKRECIVLIKKSGFDKKELIELLDSPYFRNIRYLLDEI